MLIKEPCPKCPYRLGLIKTVADPCTQCRMNGYKSFERFKKQIRGKARPSQDKDSK